jgi:hypothetical protein
MASLTYCSGIASVIRFVLEARADQTNDQILPCLLPSRAVRAGERACPRQYGYASE